MLNLTFNNGTPPALNARNMNAIVESVRTLQGQVGNPFNYKGVVADLAALEAISNPDQNDTYYVESETCLYSWTGNAWGQSSLSESDYLNDLQNLEQTNAFEVARNINRYSRTQTSNGVTFSYDASGRCAISGTATALAYSSAFYNVSSLPDGVEPGETYFVRLDGAINSYLIIRAILSGGAETTLLQIAPRTVAGARAGFATVPDNTVGMMIRLVVSEGVTVDETVDFGVFEGIPSTEIPFFGVESLFGVDSLFCTSIEANANVLELGPGNYRCGSVATASTLVGLPIGFEGAFRLFVYRMITVPSDDTYYRVLLPYRTSDFYVQVGNNEWRRMASDTTNPSSLPAVSSGDDLNTYLTEGEWRIPSAAVAKTLLHRPAGMASTGRLKVVYTHNTNHVFQIITLNQPEQILARHIRIDEEVYESWMTMLTPSHGSIYSWENKNFLLHSPPEEQAYMQEQLAKIGISVSTMSEWKNDETKITSETVYQLWDALQAKYPEYIDPGETIGYSLDTTGANYEPVKAYYIHPRLHFVQGQNPGSPRDITFGPNTAGGGTPRTYAYDPNTPTIYITAGTHGNERIPTWHLYAFFSRAFSGGTIYSDVLNGVCFRVVPCLDRWCFDNKKRYLAAAYNADGTPREDALDDDGNILEIYDANRQCICSDMSNPSYSTLQIASYATEARALTNYMQANNFANNPKDCYLDWHNNNYSLGYLTTDKMEIAYLYNTMVNNLALDWLQHSTYMSGKEVRYYDNDSSVDYVRGKILAYGSTKKSYAWFFEHAYSPYTSNIFETQATDNSTNLAVGSSYAAAKAMDFVYRWMMLVHSKTTVYTSGIN